MRWQIGQAEAVHHRSVRASSRRFQKTTVPPTRSAQLLQKRSLTINTIDAGQHQVTSRRLHRQGFQGSQHTNFRRKLHECHPSPNQSSRSPQPNNFVHGQPSETRLSSKETTNRLRFGTTKTAVKSVALRLTSGISAVCKVVCIATQLNTANTVGSISRPSSARSSSRRTKSSTNPTVTGRKLRQEGSLVITWTITSSGQKIWITTTTATCIDRTTDATTSGR